MANAYRFNQLSPKDLTQWMESEKQFFLIDVLPGDHFNKTHLPNAVNACAYEVAFIDNINTMIGEKDAVIVLCGSSSRSMDAAYAGEKLKNGGFDRLYILKGGIEAWRSAGLPLEGEAVHEPDDPQTLLKLEDRTFRVDTEKSVIEWTGRNAYSSHFGTLRIATGEIEVTAGHITGTFDIDMNSITNKDLEGDELQPVLISHLESDDFFLTKLFPTARFNILSARPVDEPYLTTPNLTINGILELRGAKAEQEFMATVTRTEDSGLAIEAHFDMDRTKWNIIYGSTRFFEHLGMHLVFDLISIQVRISAF
jgi:rhodanese-related sulfurtransferase/polyisoprenoid-binding protein YceI